MIYYYEIDSTLRKLSSSELLSFFSVRLPAGVSLYHLPPIDNNTAGQSIIRYVKTTDNSDTDKTFHSSPHFLAWNGTSHTVIIEINSDNTTTGGDVSKKKDIID
jgi:hypothetical protein